MKHLGLHIIKEDNSELMITQYSRNRTMELYARDNAEQQWYRKYTPIAYARWQNEYTNVDPWIGGINIIEANPSSEVYLRGIRNDWTWADEAPTMTVTNVDRPARSVTINSSYGTQPRTLDTAIDTDAMDRSYREQAEANYRMTAALREFERRQLQSQMERERLEAERSRERRPWERLTNFFR